MMIKEKKVGESSTGHVVEEDKQENEASAKEEIKRLWHFGPRRK